MNKKNFLGTVCVAVALSAVVSACGDGTTRSAGWEFSRNMYDPIAYNPDQPNNNFENKITAQTPPEGTNPIGFERFEYGNSVEEYERAGAESVNPLVVESGEPATWGSTLFDLLRSMSWGRGCWRRTYHCGPRGRRFQRKTGLGKFPSAAFVSSVIGCALFKRRSDVRTFRW